MKTYLRDQIDWEQPFPAEEYADRRAKVRAAMAEAGLDALYVIRRTDLKYLVDYDQIWDAPRMSTGLLMRADTDDTLFFDTSSHTTIVSLLPEIMEAVIFGEAELGSPLRPRYHRRYSLWAWPGKGNHRSAVLGLRHPRLGGGGAHG